MAGGRSVGLDLLKSSIIEGVGGSKTGWMEELESGDMDSSQFAQSICEEVWSIFCTFSIIFPTVMPRSAFNSVNWWAWEVKVAAPVAISWIGRTEGLNCKTLSVVERTLEIKLP